MSRDDNYPDDIRQYDNCPGSPFYVDPDAWMEEPVAELASEWEDEMEKTGQVIELDITLEDIHVETGDESEVAAQLYLLAEALKTVQANPERFQIDDNPLEWD